MTGSVGKGEPYTESSQVPPCTVLPLDLEHREQQGGRPDLGYGIWGKCGGPSSTTEPLGISQQERLA